MTRFVVGNKLRQDFENGRSATRPTAAANMSQKHSQNTPPKIFGEKPKPLTDAEFSVKIAKIAKIKFKVFDERLTMKQLPFQDPFWKPFEPRDYASKSHFHVDPAKKLDMSAENPMKFISHVINDLLTFRKR